MVCGGGRQGHAVAAMETLWRAHINLAHSLDAAGEDPHPNAAAALSTLLRTLEGVPAPQDSPRFSHSWRFRWRMRFVTAFLPEDILAQRTLKLMPSLRNLFSDIDRARLSEDRGGFTSLEWIRVGDADYVIY